MIKLGYGLVYQLYAGPFGLVEIKLFLIEITELIFCRLSDELRIEFSNGPTFSQWISGRVWLLDATVY
jgi:hypothetical protein